jgi:hypothetical protein
VYVIHESTGEKHVCFEFKLIFYKISIEEFFKAASVFFSVTGSAIVSTQPTRVEKKT